ncbi:MAG: hypothetical protein ACP5OO_04855 [Chloroflexia bacterium]
MGYPLALGPFHPGWPGTLRLHLEVEDGLVQGVQAELLQPSAPVPEAWAGLRIEDALVQVERLCAASSWAHSLAFCQALESLAGLEVPERARFLRLLLAELERIVAHLWTAGRILHLAGLPSAASSLLDLGEEVLEIRRRLTGRRFFPGLNVPGGLRQDLTDADVAVERVLRIKEPLYRLAHRVISARPEVAVLVEGGLVTREFVEANGVSGPVARGSDLSQDLRCDQPYAAYGEVPPEVVTQVGGDVFARWMVLLLEIFESLRLLERAVEEMPAGPVYAPVARLPAGEAQSRVEAPDGRLTIRVAVDEDGRLSGLWRTAPGAVHLAALPPTLVGQRVELVGVIVASWGLEVGR